MLKSVQSFGCQGGVNHLIANNVVFLIGKHLWLCNNIRLSVAESSGCVV